MSDQGLMAEGTKSHPGHKKSFCIFKYSLLPHIKYSKSILTFTTVCVCARARVCVSGCGWMERINLTWL